MSVNFKNDTHGGKASICVTMLFHISVKKFLVYTVTGLKYDGQWFTFAWVGWWYQYEWHQYVPWDCIKLSKVKDFGYCLYSVICLCSCEGFYHKTVRGLTKNLLCYDNNFFDSCVDYFLNKSIHCLVFYH